MVRIEPSYKDVNNSTERFQISHTNGEFHVVLQYIRSPDNEPCYLVQLKLTNEWNFIQ